MKAAFLTRAARKQTSSRLALASAKYLLSSPQLTVDALMTASHSATKRRSNGSSGTIASKLIHQPGLRTDSFNTQNRVKTSHIEDHWTRWELDQMELDLAVLFHDHDLPRSRLSSRRSRFDGCPPATLRNAARSCALTPTLDANPDFPRFHSTASGQPPQGRAPHSEAGPSPERHRRQFDLQLVTDSDLA